VSQEIKEDVSCGSGSLLKLYSRIVNKVRTAGMFTDRKPRTDAKYKVHIVCVCVCVCVCVFPSVM